MTDPQDFTGRWLDRLNDHAITRFAYGTPQGSNYGAVGDAFVQQQGLKPIGYNWELLDASPGADGPRAAQDQLVEALSKDIANPSREWLPLDKALKCAQDFLSLFDPADRTMIANRYDGLWNPIAGTGSEWAFVGYDSRICAMLLITEAE